MKEGPARAAARIAWFLIAGVPMSGGAQRRMPITWGRLLRSFHRRNRTPEHQVVSTEREKQVAAEAAADLVQDGMTVGLGTGSTVAFLLPALARRSLGILCAATSPRTEHAARELGLRMEDVTSIDRF